MDNVKKINQEKIAEIKELEEVKED